MATSTKLSAANIQLERFLEARRNSDELFRIVREDCLYERPIPERHRIIFYIGHLESFDWNLFRENCFPLKSFNPELDKLFAFGIDPVDGGLPTDRPEDWPALIEVRRYTQLIRDTIDHSLHAAPSDIEFSAQGHSLETLLHVAIEHRLMHAETLAYMFHRLPFARKRPQPQASILAAPLQPRMVKIPAGATTLGLPSASQQSFGWDNEFGRHQIEVPAFSIDKFMVTNGEYLTFLEDRGYRNRALWTGADWDWKEKQNIQHPAFWQLHNREWRYRGMFEEMPLPLDWPVYVSHAEASAYARWSHKFLPTEAQWHRAAYGTRSSQERPYPWGSNLPSETMGNFDFLRWDPAPVQAFPENESAFGVVGQLGNGWEWTSTPFAPFAGFEPFSFYPGYSANFFDGKHFVIKGGSPRTAACMLRRSFRNWFQPHYQYVYAGFRCVTN